jgi:V8-like Glu-specific endopeptidase
VHLALGKDAPDHRPIEPANLGNVVALPRLGGLHHRYSRRAAAKPVLEEGARVYIIGHPKGGTLSFSLNDNRLLDYDERLLHYRAPTEVGSSGSPVFNRDWELLGLHHGGGKDMARLNNKPCRYAANEGIWIEAIRQGAG